MVLSNEEKTDTQSPAPTSFEALGVCSQLAEAAAALGWKQPTAIQAQAVPHALQGAVSCAMCLAMISSADYPTHPQHTLHTGKDIIGLAQTGSGKTGCFALPVMQALLDKPAAMFALVLSPTRELAIQIAEQFEVGGVRICSICTMCCLLSIPHMMRPHSKPAPPCLLDPYTGIGCWYWRQVCSTGGWYRHDGTSNCTCT